MTRDALTVDEWEKLDELLTRVFVAATTPALAEKLKSLVTYVRGQRARAIKDRG